MRSNCIDGGMSAETRAQSPAQNRVRERPSSLVLSATLGSVANLSTSRLKSRNETSAAPPWSAMTPGSPCPHPSSSTQPLASGARCAVSGAAAAPATRLPRSTAHSQSLKPPS
eukprot:Amastigsp_a680179_3.p6 type:complete len:113 gc:universal Amastigsp_a680179_3:364-702(+)